MILKAEGGPSALEYHELAALVRDAGHDPVAAVRLAGLPPAEQRLGRAVLKAYSGKVRKVKVRKGGKRGAPAVPADALRASLTADLGSYDPAVREAAAKALESL